MLGDKHYRYKRFSKTVIHRREIRFYKKKGKLQITDTFEGKGEHHLEWKFILSPDYKHNLNIRFDRLRWQKKPAFFSPEYAKRNKTLKFFSDIKVQIPFNETYCIKKE